MVDGMVPSGLVAKTNLPHSSLRAAMHRTVWNISRLLNEDYGSSSGIAMKIHIQ